jgi:hypothetical protein
LFSSNFTVLFEFILISVFQNSWSLRVHLFKRSSATFPWLVSVIHLHKLEIWLGIP